MAHAIMEYTCNPMSYTLHFLARLYAWSQ